MFNRKAINVLVDILTNNITDKTVQLARDVEIEDPIVWENNDWLKIIGGAVEPIDPKWLEDFSIQELVIVST